MGDGDGVGDVEAVTTVCVVVEPAKAGELTPDRPRPVVAAATATATASSLALPGRCLTIPPFPPIPIRPDGAGYQRCTS